MEQVTLIDRWVPNELRYCSVCGESPTVSGEAGGKVIYKSELCGPDYFGTAQAINPDNWNNLD